MTWNVELVISIAAGVSVAAIVAAARAIWVRRRVPIALSQAVIRKHYVEQILELSRKDTVTFLDALSPRFTPRGDDFEPDHAGAFQVSQEGQLRPALRS